MKVYRDPPIGPRSMLAYVPEHHRDTRCRRRIAGGEVVDEPVGDDALWCEQCSEHTDRPI